MVNQYETVFIATPVLSDTQMKEAVAKYVKLITDSLPPSKPSITVTSASSASSLSLLTKTQWHTQRSVAPTRLPKPLPLLRLPPLNN